MRSIDTHTLLRAVKLFHTVIWGFFASVIVAIPLFAWQRRFAVVTALTGAVLLEVAVLAINGMRCPLTAVAARYTADRQDNFDICLPLLIARYNKEILGSLFLAGVVLASARWVGA